MKRIFNILILVLFTACSVSFGDELKLVSVAPSVTEILFAIGAGDMLKGVSSYCDYPEEARRIEKVGTFSNANMEKIVALNPDIVFTAGVEQAMVSSRLNEMGIKTVPIQPKNVNELYQSILLIAKLVGHETEGIRLCEDLRKEVESVTSKIPSAARPRVMLELWGNPLMVAGKQSFVGDLLIIAGGENIAYDTPRGYSRFSPELAIKRDPQVIILGLMQNESAELVYKRAGWSKVSAVVNKRVYADIEPEIILRPGPRFVLGLDEIRKRLYEK